MEELKASQLSPQKDSVAAEKPLEKGVDSGNGNRKPIKRSKFKSIFTRPTSQRDSVNTPPAQQSIEYDTAGKGDTKIQNPSTSAFDKKQVQKDDDAEFQSEVQSPSVSKHSSVRVEIHNAPGHNNMLADRNEETEEIVLSENVTPLPRPRQRKKVVTISDPHRETRHRRNVRRHDSGSQTPRSTSESSRKIELKALQRRNLRMKEKTKELLSLVEELTHNCEYYKNALKDKEDREETEGYQCMKEKEALNLQIFKLGQEIEEWKTKCQHMENKNTALSRAKTLSKENRDLLEDMDVLKSVICRLNKELAFYQDRLRFKFHDAPENIPLYSSGTDEDEKGDSSKTKEKAKDWLHNPRKSLLPLLIAYDEVIAEKEEIIKDHEVLIDRFKQQCLEVMKENEDLHKLISITKEKGSISIDEWEYLRSNAVLVLEENDLLHDHVENFKRKEEKLFAMFQEKADGFKQTISRLESEINSQRSTITELEAKCKRIEEENQNMSSNLQLMIPKENHNAMVQECKHAFEKLKINYEADRKALQEKIASVEKERELVNGQVADLQEENTKLRSEIKEYENKLAANTQSLQEMKASVLEVTTARDASNNVIEDFMKHVKILIAEKNKLAEDLNEQRLVNEQMMAVRSKETALVGELYEKIEAMKHAYTDEVKSVQSRVKELEEAMKTQKDLHRREKTQMNELMREKDKRIETIEAEKKQLQQDLETVWRTTTSTVTTTLKNRNT